MKTNLLNVTKHLQHLDIVLEGLRKYGYCPAIEEEINKLGLINKMILKKQADKRASGNRKDIYIPVK